MTVSDHIALNDLCGAAQAQRLGAEMLTTREVLTIRANGPSRVVTLDGGEEIGATAW